MEITAQKVKEALSRVLDFQKKFDLVTSKSVQSIQIKGQDVSVHLGLPYPAKSDFEHICQIATDALKEISDIGQVKVTASCAIFPSKLRMNFNPYPNVKNIIAVASGKGGVGKSTVSTNLALALSKEGAKVGLLDADLYGPSIPLFFGVNEKPESPDGKSFNPIARYGLDLMSIGFMVKSDEAVIWRAPVAVQTLLQLIENTNWKDLDYLVIDLPPGTGDIQLSLFQRVPVTAGIIVTTPQDVALLDAEKALVMFQKLSIPVVGIVENMSTHVCSHCGHTEAIFGEHGAKKLSEKYDVSVLGELPLQMKLREQSDQGIPPLISDPTSLISSLFLKMAQKVGLLLAKRGRALSVKLPKVVVENDQ